MSKINSIAWGITGAGHFLKESIELIEKIADKVNITIFISRAGLEVLNIYRLYTKLEQIANRYYVEIVREDNEGFSYPKVGRLYLSQYDYVIISPTTFNTLAKIANGICDTLVTNLVAHALKVRVPVALVVPDLVCPVETTVPIFIDRKVCMQCRSCVLLDGACPADAIYPDKLGLPHIDLKRCTLCEECVRRCPHGAVKINHKVTVYPHPLLAQLIGQVRRMGIKVYATPEELWAEELSKILATTTS